MKTPMAMAGSAALLILFLIAWQVQASLLFNWDNSILLHETRRLLAGGTYAKDFFETNPPMILYLYVPPIMLNNWFAVPVFLAFRLYVFIVIALSALFCSSLVNKIFAKEDALIKNVFFISLIAILLFFPVGDFGQREDFFLILSLPYCFAAACYLDHKPLNNIQAMMIGFLAGLGIGIKPFFIITPLIIELYIILHKKNWKACLRIETVCIGALLTCYCLTALARHPDYFQIVIPYALHFYYQSIAASWGSIVFSPINGYSALALIFYCVFYHAFNKYRFFINILCITLLSYACIYTVQCLPFYYHMLPEISLATALFALLLIWFIFKPTGNQSNQQLIFVFAGISLIFAMHYLSESWSILILMPELFWGYLVLVLSILFVLLYENISLLRFCLSISLVFATTYWFSTIVLAIAPYDSILGSHRCIFTLLLLLTLFVLSVRQPRLNKLNVICLTIITAIMLAVPVYTIFCIYKKAYRYKEDVTPLIKYMKNKMQYHSVYVFSSDTFFTFPLVDYANVDPVSRFPFFWMFPKLITEKTDLKSKERLNEMVADDFYRKKPDYVLVDVSKAKNNIPFHFDYLTYFLCDKRFAKAWENYHYVTTIDGRQIPFYKTYHFALYERIKHQTT